MIDSKRLHCDFKSIYILNKGYLKVILLTIKTLILRNCTIILKVFTYTIYEVKL